MVQASRPAYLALAALVVALGAAAARAQSQPAANRLKLFTWERGIGFESPARKDMRMYLRFYEWNMFEARAPGQHTAGNDRFPTRVSQDQSEAEAGAEDLLLTIKAGAGSADLALAVTNRTDQEWPAPAAIIPCFNPGPAETRNREFANTNTWYYGPGGLERLEKREIRFARDQEANLRHISPELRFVFSGKWPTASPGAVRGIIIRDSTDGKWVTGIAWEDFLSAQAHNPWECMHLAVRVGPLKPGERKMIRGKVYLFEGKKEDLLRRYLADFPQARIKVSPNERVGRIDPGIYGHFPEMCFRVFYGGLWAEMLEARKFEGQDGEYGLIRPWRSLGRTPKTHFLHDNTVFYSGGQSEKIVSRESPGHETGVTQRGLHVEKGKAYLARLNLRQQGLSGPVVVALEGQRGTYASRTLEVPEANWQRFSFALRSSETDRDAAFTVKFSGPGALWVGTASLMPGDHVSGYRKDVIEALRAIKVPNMRWPGGNFVSYYHWEDGIGDRDRRPARLNLARAINQEGLYWEPNDVGIEEFFELCRLLGAEPFLAVNAGDGTPEEAARLVEYSNGPAASPYGAKRAANGHPEPYRVKLWGIGNEMFGDWQGGHADEETHAGRVVAFAKAMRGVDAGIRLVACGARAWFYPRWNQALFELAKGHFDYLSLHSYARKYRRTMKKEDLKDPAFAREFYYYIVSAPYGIEEQIALTAQEIQAAGLQVPIAFDEWNAWAYRAPNVGYGDHEVDFAARDGLYTAGVLHAFRRQHRAVKLASFSMTVNALGLIRVNRSGLFVNPQYLVFKMYMNHQGPALVASEVRSADFPAPEYEEGRPQAVGRIPYLDASATLSEDGRKLYLAVINRHDADAMPTRIELEGWTPAPAGKALWLDAAHYMTENTFEQPDRITIRERPLDGVRPSMTYPFPPHSVTILELERQ